MMPGIQKAARNPGSPPPNHAMTSSMMGTATSGPTPCADCNRPMPVPRCRLNHTVTDAVRALGRFHGYAEDDSKEQVELPQVGHEAVSTIPAMNSNAPTVMVTRAP